MFPKLLQGLFILKYLSFIIKHFKCLRLNKITHKADKVHFEKPEGVDLLSKCMFFYLMMMIVIEDIIVIR